PAPSAEATVGVPYEPNGAGALSRALVVGGSGPFAFGSATPPSAGVTVDDAGRVNWTPSREQLGRVRLGVRITDRDGSEAVRQWVVEVKAKKSGGCSIGGDGAGAVGWWCWWWLLAVVMLARRRLRA